MASFPQPSDGKHRTNIPANHMGRRKKSNFEIKTSWVVNGRIDQGTEERDS